MRPRKYPFKSPDCAMNAPADGNCSASATNWPWELNVPFIVDLTLAVGGIKEANLTVETSLISCTVKPFASSERTRNDCVCPGRMRTSAGMTCNCVAGPGVGHFSGAGAAARPGLFPLLPKQ